MVAELTQQSPRDPLAVLLLGPTGSGKTALSLALAQEFGGEIVSCDSVAVYRGMDIGSAKPSPTEQSLVPHHLIDIADPDQPFTAGDYARLARAALNQIAARNRLPIVTGGTGLYLRALTLGLFPGPQRNVTLRDRLNRSVGARTPGWLHRMLARLDPESAARIHTNDTPKLIRALEVCFTSGQPLSKTLANDPQGGRDPLTGFRLLRIGLSPPRQLLYNRLNLRAEEMFMRGLIEETRALLTRFGKVTALTALGYRQALLHLDGSLTLPEAIAQAQQGHRNYAKRQLTWFRQEPDVLWIENFGESLAAFEFASHRIGQALQIK